MSETPPANIIAEAADWLVKMQEKALTESEQHQLQIWCARSANHQRAWQAAQRLNQSFEQVPEKLGLSILSRKQTQRRNIIKAISALLIIPTGGWLAVDYSPLSSLTADYQTATGEWREVLLADGTKLLLNTRSAVNVIFDDTQRLVELVEGEIQITTAKDPMARPFIVSTVHGRIRALGTIFNVRLEQIHTKVSVQQHAVEIYTADTGNTQQINTGQKTQFTTVEINPSTSSHPTSATAWTRQQLIADNQPLAEVITEISRYRSGWLRCDPAVAALKLSGVFQLKDTDAVLNNIAHTLPIKVVYRSDYWVTISARK